MFKKLVSAISLLAVIASFSALPVVFAAPLSADLIKSVTLTVAGSAPQTFEPSAGQILKTAITFDTTGFAAQLSNSSGSVKVMQGTKVIKTLNNWTTTGVPTQIADWDGKSIDNTPEAQGICGNTGAVCPVGDYQIVSHVEYVNGLDTTSDNDTTAFKVYITPAVAITSLAVSATTFNPVNQTSDISFAIGNSGFVTVEILDGTNVIKTLVNNENLTSGQYNKTNKAALSWDGKDVNSQIVPNKIYTARVSTRQSANGNVVDTKTISVEVNAPNLIAISAFGFAMSPVTSSGTFDPSPKGDNQVLNVSYTLNQLADNVLVEIKNSKGVLMTSFNSDKINNSFPWDGKYGSKLALPDLYTAQITATKSGSAAVVSSKTFTIAYNNGNKGTISGLSVSPSTFSSNDDISVIKFTNTVDTNITVEIRGLNDDSIIRTFTNYMDDEHGPGTVNSIPWDGTYTAGSSVPAGTYRVFITLRNDYGIVTSQQNVTVTNSAYSSYSTDNMHISGISFSPSYTFDPAKNDQLKIEYDVKQKLDSLKIYAARGSQKIELQSSSNIDSQSNAEVDWDGTDGSGGYVDEGQWRIQFESKAGATSLIAAKNITVNYNKPKVNDAYLSKSKFDNEQGEFTYIFFRVDSTANVTVQLLQDGVEQENIVEDMAVDANRWYAVSWDGSGYNYDDNLSINVLAENTVNKNVYNNKKITVDLAEDSSTSIYKANITQDYIDPVVSDGTEPMQLFYNLSQSANVKVTVYRGNTSSGTVVATLLDVQNQDGGNHAISWNGLDDNGNVLSKGLYTYKIVSSNSATDTETGLFVVGNVGDVQGGGSSNNSGSSNSNSNSNNKVGPGVVIDSNTSSNNTTDNSQTCSGFTDVNAKNTYCDAITWAKDQGIFKGYLDGTFGVNKPIARVELLKVIMESLKIATQKPTTNLGFSDVDTTQWYMEYLQAGKQLGIMNGDAGKGTVRPYDSSQRVEALKMIFEAMKTTGAIGQINATCTQSHPDVLVNSWYGKYACEADNLKLYDTAPNEDFGVSTWSTRGEIAEVLYRLHLAGLI